MITKACIDEIPRQLLRPTPTRILSIDMGLRNMAYCLLEVETSPRSRPAIVREWKRIQIIKPNLQQEPEAQKRVTPFLDTAQMAQLAFELIQSQLPKADTILIEEQRFRTGGASMVQEWTLRVNKFEAMIHAVLCTLSKIGDDHWRSVTSCSVSPLKVAGYWYDKFADLAPLSRIKEKGKARASTNRHAKQAKISMRDRIMVEGLLVRRQSVQGEKEVTAAETGKQDDLADCLLQGLAWIEWHKNRIAYLDTLK